MLSVVMLSVENNPFMRSVIILRVFMPNVIKLSVVVLQGQLTLHLPYL